MGGGVGLATGLVVALFPFAAVGGGLLAGDGRGRRAPRRGGRPRGGGHEPPRPQGARRAPRRGPGRARRGRRLRHGRQGRGGDEARRRRSSRGRSTRTSRSSSATRRRPGRRSTEPRVRRAASASRAHPAGGRVAARLRARWLRGDVAAGIAVTALVVPKNLGYAGIAGVPLQNGLYAAAAGGDHLRALLHLPAHLDRAELVARGGRGRRGGRRPASAGSRRRSSSRRSRWRPGCCSCCSRSCGWAGSPASSRRRWSRGSWREPPSTWSSASCRSSPARPPRATTPGASSASWLGSLGDMHGTTLLVGVTALAVILGLRCLAPAVPGALVLVAGGLLASCAVRPRRARRRAGRRRAARASRPGAARSRAGPATTTRPSPSRRWRCC